MGSRAAATAPLTDITALAGDCGAAGGAAAPAGATLKGWGSNSNYPPRDPPP